MVASPAPPITETPAADQEYPLPLDDLVIPQEAEAAALTMVQHILRQQSTRLELVAHGPNGVQDTVELPASALAALQALIYHLAEGSAVKSVPIRKKLTTYEAASLLNVSHQYLRRLLEQGDIPSHQVSGLRFLRRTDVLTYKQRRDAECAEGLRRLVRLTEEYGLYEKTLTPPAQWQRLDPDSIVPPTEE